MAKKTVEVKTHKDCKFYREVDGDYGRCLRYPPCDKIRVPMNMKKLSGEKLNEYPVVNGVEEACGEAQ